jgi:hypothetical protein
LAAPAAAAASAAVSAWCLTVARNFTHACIHYKLQASCTCTLFCRHYLLVLVLCWWCQ